MLVHGLAQSGVVLEGPNDLPGAVAKREHRRGVGRAVSVNAEIEAVREVVGVGAGRGVQRGDSPTHIYVTGVFLGGTLLGTGEVHAVALRVHAQDVHNIPFPSSPVLHITRKITAVKVVELVPLRGHDEG